MEDNILRWFKKGEVVPTYYCPKCGKEASIREWFIDDFRTVRPSFCPFCGIRFQHAK